MPIKRNEAAFVSINDEVWRRNG